MLLSELLKDIINIDPNLDHSISGLATDSRVIKPGYLFIAMPGVTTDGRNFIADAVKRGAVAVICEEEEYVVDGDYSVAVILVSQLQSLTGSIVSRFYGNPTKKMDIIGITGTNGKTSCSQFIAEALQTNGHLCGIIGTLGAGFPGKLELGRHTTPDVVTVQQQLAAMYAAGAKAIAMEVSSHALVQQRVSGIDFNIAVFTNLSRDHLDYHGDMVSYGNAKRRLFRRPELQYAVINVDDEFGLQLFEELAGSINVVGYSVSGFTAKAPMITTSEISFTAQGCKARVLTPWGEGELVSNLLGRFNVSNLLAVLGVLCLLKIPLADALSSLAQLTTVPGRMQVFGGGKQPLVVVDYAHTPDALAKALAALREHCHGSLWCLFGCGGERDRGKRPLMGQIAERLSDHIIVSNDNPRREPATQIIEEILAGLVCPWAAEVEPDRAVALAHAIDCAQKGDIVLVAGKGHEPYQVIGDKKLPYSDIEQVKQLLSR